MLLDDMLANTNRRSLMAFPIAWLQSPGFAVLISWRLAKKLSQRGLLLRIFALFIWRFFVANRGCYISLKASIGRRFRLPHAIGIVIGDGAVIGDDVTMYQNVTLGRLKSEAAVYPVIENGVQIYSGSLIAGGVTVGQSAIIGANSVVLADVPANSTAVGAPARILVRTVR